MDRRKNIYANRYEKETDETLSKALKEFNAEVLKKVRVADVLDINKSGLTDEEYNYALKSHFDFSIVDEKGNFQFAVEFDEPYHNYDEDAKRRDTLKNAICEKLGLPLLRIDADYLRKAKNFSLVGYLANIWFMDKAWDEAQQKGEVPFDEPFMPHSVMEDLKTGEKFPYDLSIDSRIFVMRFVERNKIKNLNPTGMTAISPLGFSTTIVPVEVNEDRWIMGMGKCKMYYFPVPILPKEISQDLEKS